MATNTTSEGVGSDPEVPERAKRRRFTAEYKLGIVQEADRCSPGEAGSKSGCGHRPSASPTVR